MMKGILQVPVERFPSGINLVLMWAVMIPEEYIHLLQRHKPLALVISANFCFVLHHFRHVWWLNGWSMRVLRTIWSVL